ncbi:MAG: stage 0 sporulation protein [Elusimicrobiota bacterium]|jgi:cell fate regulator YaaT (PSP1 superfamily)|nr:stage 0 sporulation protein [Elusimicrobiota bacterium]
MPMAIGAIVRIIKDKVYAQAGHLDLQIGDKVIIETDHGLEAGIVSEKEKEIADVKDNDKNFIGRVLRKINQDDLKKIAENEEKHKKIFETVFNKSKDHELDMKLTRVQYTFDRSKLFVYYTSESRVDFRELIKDLGHSLKTRIQMVQIGVRDESKLIGGLGICGRSLCCQKFLKDFNSVTIDKAKDQDLSLNTAKLSGLCGRLMCCIAYENDYYKEAKEGLPKIGEMISTPNGLGKFSAIDCIRSSITVEFNQGTIREFKKFPLDVIKNLNKRIK